jgi:uncharacterized membrane protein
MRALVAQAMYAANGVLNSAILQLSVRLKLVHERAASVYPAVLLVLILIVTVAAVVAQCISSTSDPESGVYIP